MMISAAQRGLLVAAGLFVWAPRTWWLVGLAAVVLSQVVIGSAWGDAKVGTIANALATYVRSIVSGNSPFDRFINGDRAALSPQQQVGLQIFRGKGNCTACHVGELHFNGRAFRVAGCTKSRMTTPSH